jgi:hypothetical protein
METDTLELYRGLQYGTAQGVAGAALFKKLCRGKTPEELRDNLLLAPLIGHIRKGKENYIKREIPVLPFSLFKLFDTSGNRTEYQEAYFERRKGLLVLALSSWFWKNPEDTAALEDLIWAICDEYSWCLPAHMGGTSLRYTADPGDDKALWLDLFACETGFALAECCAMLEDILAPAVKARARGEINRRVIQPYAEHGGLWNWELMDNNWCAVCAGSLAGAAMYLVEDDLRLGGLLRRLMPSFERYIGGFYPDGVCPEGLSYWTYGMSFYLSFTDLLFHRTGGKIDLLKDPRISAIARFQQHCYFPGGASLRFSDAAGGGDDQDGGGDTFRLGLSCYLAEYFEGTAVPAHPFTALLSGGLAKNFIDPCGRFAPALRDLLWANGRLPLKEDSPGCVVFPSAQWLLCTGGGETGFAAKGGHNEEPHNHNDVGSFIFYKKGRMVLCDLGAGEYTRDYFSEKRYTIFCNQSESHNVPIIDGGGQKAGKIFRAADCRIDPLGKMSMDIAAAYQIPELARLERRFVFDPAGALRMEDIFTFKERALPVVERFLSPYTPLIEGGIVYLDTGDARCGLRGPENLEPLIGEVEYRDHEGRAARVFTIDYHFPRGYSSGGLGFSAAFIIQ